MPCKYNSDPGGNIIIEAGSVRSVLYEKSPARLLDYCMIGATRSPETPKLMQHYTAC